MNQFEDKKYIPTLTRSITNHNTMEAEAGLDPKGCQHGASIYVRWTDTGGTNWDVKTIRTSFTNGFEMTLDGDAELYCLREFAQFILDATNFFKNTNNPQSIDGVKMHEVK